MSILIFTSSISGKSGIEKSVISTANLLSRNNMDVSICTISNAAYNGRIFTYPQAFKLDDNVKRFSLKEYHIESKYAFEKKSRIKLNVEHKFYRTSFSEYDLEVIREIDAKLNEDDIVIFAVSMAAELFKIAGIKPRYKTIMQIHSDYEQDESNRNHLLNSLEIIDYIQPVAKEMKPYLKKITGFEDERIVPIYNVLNFSDKQPELQKEKSDKFRISIVGSLQERKNQIDALKVIKNLNDEYILQVFGGTNTKYYNEMLKYIEEHNIANQVEFMGYMSEEEIYSCTDLLIITAKSEGFGYTLLEAAYYGIPAVTYNYKYGANEIIEDGINGYLINFDDVNNFTEKIRKLKEDKSLYIEFSQNIQETFFTKFSAKKIYNDYLDLVGKQNGNKLFDSEYYNNAVFDFEVKFYKENRFTNILKFEIPKHVDIENKDLCAIIYGKKKKLKYSIVDGKIETKYRSIHKYAFTYVVLEDSDGMQTYLFNLNSRGKIEKIKIHTFCEDVTKKNLLKINSKLDVMWVENPRNKTIVNVYDNKTNEKLEFIAEKKVVDGYYTELVKILPSSSEFYLKYDDMNIEYKYKSMEELNYIKLFKLLEELENKYDLFNFKIDGIYVWEIIRPNLVIRFLQDNDIFGCNPTKKNEVLYKIIPSKFNPKGTKLLCNTTNDIDLYKSFVDENFDIQVINDLDFIEMTKQFGNQVEKINNCNFKNETINEMEKVNDLVKIINTMNIYIDQLYIKNDIKFRVMMFKAQYKYYNILFRDRNYEEVYIVSSVWTPGIVQAAKDNNIICYEVQYALATNYHLNYGIDKNKKNYKPDIFLTWSKFWENKKLFADKFKSINGNLKPYLLKELKKYDVAFISQHLLTNYSIEYLTNFSKKNPGIKIAYLAHPKEVIEESFLKENKNIKIFKGVTTEAISSIDTVIGMFSTSLYEAAYYGKDVYVLDVPGSEMVQEDFFNFISFDDYSLQKNAKNLENAKKIF